MSKGKYILTLSGVLFMVMLLVSGSTFAYWRWQSNDNTIINVTADQNGVMFIDPPNPSKTGMRPTSDCDGDYAMSGTATVTINNGTGITLRPTFKLKAKASKALTAAIWGKINYAIVDDTAGTTCDTTTYKGAFSTGTFTSGTAANTYYHTGEISVGSTFDVPPYNGGSSASIGEAQTRTYTLYVWIDSSYTATNTGTTVSDKLQNNTITVTWSENSILTQVSA